MSQVNLGAPQHHGFGLHIEDHDVDLLTRLLVLPPTVGVSRPSRRWLQQQRDGVVDLPDALCKPRSLTGRFSIQLSKFLDTAMPQVAILCEAHAGLHPWLVRALFKLLADELTARLDVLRRYYREKQIWGADEGGEERRAAVKATVGRLQAINALWTGPPRFRAIFGEQDRLLAPGDQKYVLVEGGCEACILAAVGARGGALADLRATLVSRWRTSRAPRLLRFVESWIEWFGDGSWALVEESDRIAEVLRRARWAVREVAGRERARGRRARKVTVMVDEGRSLRDAKDYHDRRDERDGGGDGSWPPRYPMSGALQAPPPRPSSNRAGPPVSGGRFPKPASVGDANDYIYNKPLPNPEEPSGYDRGFPPVVEDASNDGPQPGMCSPSNYLSPQVEDYHEWDRQHGDGKYTGSQPSYDEQTRGEPLPLTVPGNGDDPRARWDYDEGHIGGPTSVPYSPSWAPARAAWGARIFLDETTPHCRPSTPDSPDAQGAAIGDWYERNSQFTTQGPADFQDMHPAFRPDYSVTSAVPPPLVSPPRSAVPETERPDAAGADAGASNRGSVTKDDETWVSVSVQTYFPNPLPPNDPSRRPPPVPQLPEAHRRNTVQGEASSGKPPAPQPPAPQYPQYPSSSVYAPEGEWGGPPPSSGGFLRHLHGRAGGTGAGVAGDRDKMVQSVKSVVFRDPFEEGDGTRSEAGWRRQPS